MSDLKRYGIKWTGLNTLQHVPMEDGHWTPWHLAEETLADKNKKIAELEESVSILQQQIEKALYDQPANKLEQRAKGVYEALSNVCGNGKTKPYLKDRLFKYAEKLRKQAKELKAVQNET
jgi:hypothetical protein